jgi:hypothetical protein
MVDGTSGASQYQRELLRVQAYRESPPQVIGQGARCPAGHWCSDMGWEDDEPDLQCIVQCPVDCGIGVSGLQCYICRAPTHWQLPPIRHNSRLHIESSAHRLLRLHLQIASSLQPNAALLDLFLFLFLYLFLFLSPFPGDRCCAAHEPTSTYPTKPRLDCARSLETPRYSS